MDYNTLRERRDIRLSGPADPLVTTIAEVSDTYRNTTSFEIFTCTNIVGSDKEWAGTQGTFVLSILSPSNPNLVSMYTMDNISGSTLVDESPNNNDGTITGATQVTGHIDSALAFASGQFVDIGNLVSERVSSYLPFTLALITRLNNVTNKLHLFASSSFSSNQKGFNINHDTRLAIPAGDRGLRFFVSDGTGIGGHQTDIKWGSGFPLSAGVTYILFFVSDGTNVTLYIDNVSAGAKAMITTFPVTGTPSTYLGNFRQNTSAGFHTDGWIDQWRYIDKAIDADERALLFNSGVGA
jgi:hypothetical protein